jgi:hypothetical protein
MNTTQMLPAVSRYAAAVRAALTGLGPSLAEELTEGLEADLMESLADTPAGGGSSTDGEGLAVAGSGGDTPGGEGLTAADGGGRTPGGGPTPGGENAGGLPEISMPDAAAPAPSPELVLDYPALVARFGDPVDYTAELRSAAGLEPVNAEPDQPAASTRHHTPLRLKAHHVLQELWDWLLVTRRAVRAQTMASALWPGLSLVGRILRPLWWVGRGWVFWEFGEAFLNRGGFLESFAMNDPDVLLLAICIGFSVWLGLVRWNTQTRPRRILMALFNTGVAFVVIIGVGTGALGNHGTYPEDSWDQSGACAMGDSNVCVGGEPVTNIYPFDSEGNPLTDVQLFDQDGNPLVLSPDWNSLTQEHVGHESYFQLVPTVDAEGRKLFNVFPFRGIELGWNDLGNEIAVDPGAEPSIPPMTRPIRPEPLRNPAASETPAPSASDTAAPAPSGSSAPTPADPE